MKESLEQFYLRYKNQILLASWSINLLLLMIIIYLTLGPKGNGLNQVTDNFGLDNIAYNISEQKGFYIEILGYVQRPGVYYVTKPVLVLEALNMAGGVTEDADLQYVHQSIKLSKLVEDQEKIYIPAKATRISSQNASALGELVSLNSATVDELDRLPGVGIVTAEKIIAARPFAKIEDLKNLAGLSANEYNKIVTLVKI
jgi:competence protein ComEA